MRLAIISDIHYAGPEERARPHRAFEGIPNPIVRTLIRAHRHFLWLRDPFAHNHLLDHFMEQVDDADYIIANGDFSCDTGYVGVADAAAHESAQLCLGKLRDKFDSRLLTTYGDHELGKKKMGGDEGGLRVASWHRCRKELDLEPFWQMEIGNYLLMGVVSTLIALPIFKAEALPSEWDEWNRLREAHLAEITRAFHNLRPNQRLLLFCHDPTALPFLHQMEAVRDKLPQIERTIIGHLHSKKILQLSRILSGVPKLTFGHTVQRITTALGQVRYWKPFNVLLCPSPSGLQIFKDGGYYTVNLAPEATTPAEFQFSPFHW